MLPITALIKNHVYIFYDKWVETVREIVLDLMCSKMLSDLQVLQAAKH